MVLMDLVEDHECRLLITPEGSNARQSERGPGPDEGNSQVLGVGSTTGAREELKANEVPIFEGDVLAGLSGALLNEGVDRTFDVITPLSGASAEIPDARVVAEGTRSISRMML